MCADLMHKGLDHFEVRVRDSFAAIRDKKPLVHCITNYVTVNDCANALLAIGASPVMADDIREIDVKSFRYQMPSSSI